MLSQDPTGRIYLEKATALAVIQIQQQELQELRQELAKRVPKARD